MRLPDDVLAAKVKMEQADAALRADIESDGADPERRIQHGLYHPTGARDIRTETGACMSEEKSLMLNTPAETEGGAAEDFGKNAIARLDRAQEARAELKRTLAESPEHAQERVENFRQEFHARLSEITGLSFDADGQCTTPGEVEMEGEVKERWAELCKQIGENQDPQKSRQLLQEAGRLLRGAIATPEAPGQDETGMTAGDR